jgi:hypothetical protein
MGGPGSVVSFPSGGKPLIHPGIPPLLCEKQNKRRK